MFLWEPLTWYQILMFIAVLCGLMLLNEFGRANLWTGILLFFVVPLILTFAVWTKTAVPGSSVGTWFHWAKVYSSLAGCLGFLALRYVKGAAQNKYFLMFPPAILSINILEAVIRDFQCFSFNGFVDGMLIIGGPWNIMNGIAGILNIITISGWAGIYISQNRKRRDMIWPDQLWFWIIAYDLWNFAYVYNCVPDHSFYAGAALLLSCTIPAFLSGGKGAWLQHRAHTLGIWMMFVMTFPAFVDTSIFAVKSSHDPAALMVVSGLSLASNIAVFVYHYYKVFKYKKNILKGEEVHTDLGSYRELKELDRIPQPAVA
ncbi:hypothetical protein SAMN02745221_00772 [Thermosyntropha lipolytica DSM 11003]|uniref:Uncharacterized protein n=1 Tax=Thermosyntropha lipolytica DSM 11003 TaxID=1123382 RepID=A0A1M5LWN8_9FIRM|nr:DUF5692 family protein [Thermosyntropha lipolytica]SHG69416.1 hypothetical protein SAMN02745221_00772 [Thermosyntropha lipolytica DSM 11003]